MSLKTEKIAIVGSGFIGRSWAMLFASVGYQIVIYDVEVKQTEAAIEDIKNQLHILEKNGLLKGKLTANEQFNCIKVTPNLSEAIEAAFFIQECIPEDLELKKKVWQQIDDICGPNTILSSSTSSFVPSLFTENLKNRKNALVSHPVNPPYYIPLVEIVPATWTDASAIKKTHDLMVECGQAPVVLKKEISGFALNRIQFLILNECWNLVSDGVLSVEDVDKVMSEGLGWRYAFLGPLETAHLNAEGWMGYCKKYADAIYNVGLTFKPPLLKFEGLQTKEVARQLEEISPSDKLESKRQWRDMCLTKLALLKRSFSKNFTQ